MVNQLYEFVCFVKGLFAKNKPSLKSGQWILLEGPYGQQHFSLLEKEEDLLLARALLSSKFKKVSLDKCFSCKTKSRYQNACLNCFH